MTERENVSSCGAGRTVGNRCSPYRERAPGGTLALMTVPAGWYPNPVPEQLHRGVMRYWDGTAWTEHFHDPERPPPPSSLRDKAAGLGIHIVYSTYAGLGQPCTDVTDPAWERNLDPGVVSVVEERNGNRS